MQAINETFSCWKSQAKQRNEKKKGINKHDASFYDLHLFELVIPQIPTTQHVLKFENMKVYFHFQVQNRKLFASLLTGHSLQGISCSVLNKSRKSKIHKLGFDTPNVASVQKHKYIELQYLKRRKLFYLEDHSLQQMTQSRKRKEREKEIEEKDFENQQRKSKRMKKTLKRTQIKVDNENEKEEKEMNELTLSQQKVLRSDYMIRDDDDINDDDNDMDPLLQITDVSMDDDPLLQFSPQKNDRSFDPLLQFSPQRTESNFHQQNLMEIDDTTDWILKMM